VFLPLSADKALQLRRARRFAPNRGAQWHLFLAESASAASQTVQASGDIDKMVVKNAQTALWLRAAL
jgi:hypothetical protein